MYSLHAYGGMIRDEPRMAAYAAALEQAIRPGCVVLDIGTGTGIHALLAARLGAGRVYAVEPADAVVLGPRLARANGCEDRIRFIQDVSTHIELPEPVDVVVSDLHGTLPWYRRAIPTIIDARRRFLAPDGVLIPGADRVSMVPVEAPELFAHHAEPWNLAPHGIELDGALEHMLNTFSRGRVDREAFLGSSVTVAELDYRTASDPNVSVEQVFGVERPGTLHGLLVWMDTRLIDGVELSSAPWRPEISYGSAFFPLEVPVSVEEGDRVEAVWWGRLSDKDYIWGWDTRVVGRDGEARASFSQNSFRSALLSTDRLRRRATNHRPTLDARGRADHDALSWMNGRRSLAEIAQLLASEHTEVFADEGAALERVRELSEEYG